MSPKLPGRVTVAGKSSDHVSAGPRATSRSEGPGEATKGGQNFSAYAPDLPGCVATGATLEETEREIRDSIRFHIAGLIEDGLAVPSPTTVAEYVEA